MAIIPKTCSGPPYADPKANLVAYLDNNATTMVAPEVADAMVPYLRGRYGNPSSIHSAGRHARRAVESAREDVASLIGADPSEVVFTSGGTEGDNLAVLGAVEDLSEYEPTLITTAVEHAAVMEPFRRLSGRFKTVFVGVDADGGMKFDELQAAISSGGPCVVSVMMANNETGVMFPVSKVVDMVKSRGGIVHSDAVQAAGKVPVNVAVEQVDLLTISGHKIHGPKGVGALYVREGIDLPPLLVGGRQERGVRPGTENVPGIVGLGVACRLAKAGMAEMGRVAKLRDRFEAGVVAGCDNVFVNGAKSPRVPNTTNITFAYADSMSMLYHLDEMGVAASSGAACSSGAIGPSHVIQAMGAPAQSMHGAIRFSLSRYTSDDEVDLVIRLLPAVLRVARGVSPYAPPRR